jgi:hypothetical protein
MKYAPRFTALCPRCTRDVDQGTFRFHALQEFLDEGTLRLYCQYCDLEWRPSEQDSARVERLLSRRAAAA